MSPDLKPAAPCPDCGGPVTCRYNHFEKPGLVIDAWEHKCGDCGVRCTQAFRREGDEAIESGERAPCPYCGRAAAR